MTKSRAFEGVPGLLRVAAGRRVKRLQQFCGQELRNPPDTNSILSIRMSRNRKKTHAQAQGSLARFFAEPLRLCVAAVSL
ncbi:MAG: hypothetical protein DKINENOH_01070 [bacterium]|nr:hypothetical protein [bacterium]